MLSAAFFDVDGTLSRTTILHPLDWYQRAHLSGPRYALWALGVLIQVPRYLWIDRHNRSRVNEIIYRHYAGLPVSQVRAWHRETFEENFRRVLFPLAVACVAEHRAAGRRIVLVTGGADFVMDPLAEALGGADVVATRLAERDGRFTGKLACAPIADGRKAELIHAYAKGHDIDLTASYAYSDSHGDLPMLGCVGHPVAANPDRALRKLAQKRGWPIVTWR